MVRARTQPRRDLPSTDSLRAFAAAARSGSFKQAARDLHVSASALSRRIQALEEHLGTPLFARLNPGLVLTEAGARYREAVDRVLAPLEAAQEQLASAAGVRVLRVTSLASFTENWLVPNLPDFERAHPELHVEIEATLRYADFQRERVDAGIRFGAGPWQGLHSEPLLETLYSPVCAPKLARGEPPPRRVADLAQHTLIHLSQVPDAWRWWLRRARQPALVPRREVTYDHMAIVLSAAEAGQGAALASPLHCERRVREGRLLRPFAVSVRSPHTYHFVCRPEGLQDPAILGLRDWLVKRLAAPKWGGES
ncbi:MAG TPA: LysR substrate-binding domain-containing protein [Myxococcota bacterium]|nr:LysR substrate-binding domain-containing protein [Myxococcota bacterium]